MTGVVFAAVGLDTRYMAAPLRRLKGEADEFVVFSLQPSAPEVEEERADENDDVVHGPYEVEEARYRAPDERLETAQILLKEEITQVCLALGIRFKIVGIPADADFESALRVIREHLSAPLKAYGPGCVRQFFLSDTTLTVNVAVVTACYLEGVPLFVADAAKGGMVPIPIVRMRYETGLSSHDMRALKILDQQGPMTIGELAQRLGRKVSTLSERISRMEASGVVSRVAGPTARERRVEILPQGRVILRAAEETA